MYVINAYYVHDYYICVCLSTRLLVCVTHMAHRMKMTSIYCVHYSCFSSVYLAVLVWLLRVNE